MKIPALQSRFDALACCVLLPTYNNAGTLAAVIEDVLSYTSNIIVINDGSTDATASILGAHAHLQIFSHAPNKGKGFALRRGIREAAIAGYTYAIVMDSDGQHFAKDLAVFPAAIEAAPGALIIGARNMGVANVPGKSSFGNRFSNFWVWVTTGLKLPDTQSGYRLYPVKKLAEKKFLTRKYEFEIEVLVRASWSGIPVLSIPVSVYYPPADERITHFRPFWDFFRISVLNTVLVLIALLWIKPRDFIRLIFSAGGIKKLWKALAVNTAESNVRKASAIAFGVFMGIAPVWGFQLLIGIPAAIALRLNKALFLAAAHISVFPLTPVWWVASLATGKLVLGHGDWSFRFSAISLERAAQEGAAFFLGGTVLALVLGAAAFGISLAAITVFRKRPVGGP